MVLVPGVIVTLVIRDGLPVTFEVYERVGIHILVPRRNRGWFVVAYKITALSESFPTHFILLLV